MNIKREGQEEKCIWERVKENIGKYINCCFAYPHAFIVQHTTIQRNLS
jgi:hypothetical protein